MTDGWWDEGVPGFFDGAVHGRWPNRQRDNRARIIMENAGLRPFVATTLLREDPRLFSESLEARRREAAESSVKSWRMHDGRILLRR